MFNPGDIVEIPATTPKWPEWAGVVIKVNRAKDNWIEGKVLRPSSPETHGYAVGDSITFSDASVFILVTTIADVKPKDALLAWRAVLEKDLPEHMNKTLARKGTEAFISSHETLGHLHEELFELTQEIHKQDKKRIRSELMDVAITALWGVASLDA